MAAFTRIRGGAPYVCPACRNAAERVKWSEIEEDLRRQERISLKAAELPITTTDSIDGYRVVRYIGIESVEYVIGTGVFSEIASGLADLVGSRSTGFEHKLQDAKNEALAALKYRAAERGGNAVIGIDLDFTEFSGNRVALIANGTVVVIEPITPEPAQVQAQEAPVPDWPAQPQAEETVPDPVPQVTVLMPDFDPDVDRKES
jgi:uncharacterized protein YbjQ (UPF0145 family)